MGFGNSPFRIIACDTPEPLPTARPVSDFGQLDRAKLEEADRPILLPSVDDEYTSALSDGMPSLASAIQIRETGPGSCRNTTNPDPVPAAARASTWRALPRSLSRNSLFESWSHGKGRKGSMAGQDLQQACGNQQIDAKPDTFRDKRKMSIDNIVHSISRRSQLFRVKHEESGPIQDSESRRWTAVHSEASDDSVAPKARTAAIDTQSNGIRMALPPMRSLRNKFTLTKRDSRRGSVLDIGSGRNGSPIRLSAMFQRPFDTHPAQGRVQSSAGPLELSDVQETVEINRSPNPAQVPTPQQPATTIGPRRSAAAAASALTLALSPARDDISILDPSRTPMVMPPSVSMTSLHLIKGNASVPRVAGDLDERLQRTELPHTMDQNLLDSANSIPSDGSSRDMSTKTGNISLPASDSRNVLLSTMSSLRTMSELASTDSSESLAARMRQSLSELKSAFKRMRNMSELDLSSDGSRRTSGNDDPAILHTTENTAPVEDTTKGEDVHMARSRREQGHVAGEQSMSSTKMTAFMSASESFTGTDGRMSCAPSGTSWHTAKEDLQISYGSLTGLSWRGS